MTQMSTAEALSWIKSYRVAIEKMGRVILPDELSESMRQLDRDLWDYKDHLEDEARFGEKPVYRRHEDAGTENARRNASGDSAQRGGGGEVGSVGRGDAGQAPTGDS